MHSNAVLQAFCKAQCQVGTVHRKRTAGSYLELYVLRSLHIFQSWQSSAVLIIYLYSPTTTATGNERRE